MKFYLKSWTTQFLNGYVSHLYFPDNFTFYFAIKGQSEDSSGPLSNIISITLREILVVDDDENNDDDDSLPLILGLSMTAAFIVIAIITVIIFIVLPRYYEDQGYKVNDSQNKRDVETKGVTNMAHDV